MNRYYQHLLFLLLALALTGSPVAANAQDPSLTASPGVDFQAPPRARNRLTDHLWYGADLVSSLERVDDLDLDSDEDDHLTLLEPELRGVLAYIPNNVWQAFVEAQFDGQVFLSKGPENDDSSRGRFRIRQLYAKWNELGPGLSLQLGRQRYKDIRSWWYDERIDAVRLAWQNDRWAAELTAARAKAFPDDLFHSETDDRTDYYMLMGQFTPKKRTEFNAYLIAKQDNETDDREDPVFLGFQAAGRITSDLRYWANLAGVRGRADGRDIDAFGVDLGAGYRFDAPMEPFVTLAAAYGSGDADLDDGDDGNFRQTGLQDNESRMFGATSYNYYGEVLDPELSNMSIWSVTAGLRPSENASVELAYHKYRQVEAVDDLFDTDLEEDPNGFDRDLGEELDLIVALRATKRFKVSLIVGGFFPGDAFDDDADPAYLAKLKFSYRF